ncbi:hypothetical protein [Sphingobium mellinum]|uniref:hypothetical protein n=1 Tax=Sphingobium mellinum TaxID=1387166 RepID=UPI0030EC9DD6
MGAIFSRIWPHLLAVAAIACVVWAIDHRGYERAQADERLARAEAAATFNILLRRSEGRLAAVVTSNDRTLADKIAAVRIYHRTIIQPALEREIAHDPFLARRDARLSDGVLRELNAARTGSACSRRTDGGIECALPAAVFDLGSTGGDASADQPGRRPHL